MAKVFAYAVGAEILGIGVLEAIAAAAPRGVSAISAAVDAQRGDVVAQRFRRGSAGWMEPAGDSALVPFDLWLAALPPGFAVSGPVLRKQAGPAPTGVVLLDPAYWHPTAGNVARLAYRDYLSGRRDDLWNLLPVYSRPSAAEEKWARRKSDGG